MKHENWVADNESKLESQKMIIFLTREFRMRNTGKCVARSMGTKTYANEVRLRLTLKSLFIFN